MKIYRSAVRIQKAGIDGVGSPCCSWIFNKPILSPYTNRRKDKYGGSLENRMRFLEEIIFRDKGTMWRRLPLIVRLSVDEHLEYIGLENEGLRLEEGKTIAKRLEELGVDALDISCGIYETMNVSWEPSSFEQGWKINLQEEIKKVVDIPVIGVSVIRDPEFADKMIAEGKIDFAGSARQHFADPEWSNKAKEGRVDEIRRCISCLHCMDSLMGADITGNSTQCAINIPAGKECEYSDLKRTVKIE